MLDDILKEDKKIREECKLWNEPSHLERNRHLPQNSMAAPPKKKPAESVLKTHPFKQAAHELPGQTQMWNELYEKAM